MTVQKDSLTDYQLTPRKRRPKPKKKVKRKQQLQPWRKP